MKHLLLLLTLMLGLLAAPSAIGQQTTEPVSIFTDQATGLQVFSVGESDHVEIVTHSSLYETLHPAPDVLRHLDRAVFYDAAGTAGFIGGALAVGVGAYQVATGRGQGFRTAVLGVGSAVAINMLVPIGQRAEYRAAVRAHNRVVELEQR